MQMEMCPQGLQLLPREHIQLKEYETSLLLR